MKRTLLLSVFILFSAIIIAQPVCNVSGQLIGSDTMTGISGFYYLHGDYDYQVETDVNGFFSINNVNCNYTYQQIACAQGYFSISQELVVGTADIELGQIVLQEVTYPISELTAEVLDNDEVLLNWDTPQTSGLNNTWLYKDDGVNSDGVGLSNGGVFEVACKYEVNELNDYLGLFINTMRLYIQSSAVSVTIKIYSGENGDLLLHEQSVPTYNIDAWNEVQLDTSIPITGDSPIWLGYEVEHTSEYRPVGCDEGPHQSGGDMIKTTDVWEELHIIAPTLDCNWNLQAYVSELPFSSGSLLNRRVEKQTANHPLMIEKQRNISPLVTRIVQNRTFLDYTVFRLNMNDENNPENWIELATIQDTTYTDSNWIGANPGVYKYAVQANYTNGYQSYPILSNWLPRVMYGSLTINLTTNSGDTPLGASINLTALTPNPDGIYNEYSGLTNNQGIATISDIWLGNYRIVASLDGYQGSTIESYIIDGANELDMMITEYIIPSHDVRAEVDEYSTFVSVHWGEPNEGSIPQWFAWDSGQNSSGVGTGAEAQFDIACRWEPEFLDDYGGMFITKVKFYPREANCEYSVRVWSGENAQTILIDQLCNNITSYNNWHTEILNNPVQIDASQELWVGVSVDTQTGHPVGCDQGPAIDGFGNMMLWGGTWQTLLEVNEELDYNWNLQAWVDWDTNGENAIRIGKPFIPESNRNTNSDLSLLTTDGVNREIREVLGYNLYRFIAGTESSPQSWNLIEVLTADTLFTDYGWTELPSNDYRYAVRAVYTGGFESTASISNIVHKDQRGYLQGLVTDINTQESIPGAVITVDTLTIVTDDIGYYIVCLDEGFHDFHVEANMYLPLELYDLPVLGEYIEMCNIELTPRAVVVGDDFESYSDFSLEFGDWELIDNDNDNTISFANIEFDNQGEEMAFMVFNPNTAVPPVPFASAHSGDKYIACFSSLHEANDDWIISPTIQLGDEGGFVSFWARSYTSQFGFEHLNVGVSTESEGTDSFVMFNNDNPLEVGIQWTYYSYDLSEYVGDVIRVGLNCCSCDRFALFIDDLSIDSVNGVVDNSTEAQPILSTKLLNNYPNPFNPTTNINFELKQSENVVIDVYKIKGQFVSRVADNEFGSGRHSVLWNGRDQNNKQVSSGIYFYKMKSGTYTKTRKMILIK